MELAEINLRVYKCYHSFRRALGATFRLLRNLERLDCLVCSRPLPLVRGLAHSVQ
jgi:hypothetical protein